MIISKKKLSIFLVTLFLVFLTFKYLISINLGFGIRVPHLLISLFFLTFLSYLVLKRRTFLKFTKIVLLFSLILLISILNLSFYSLYFYYLIFIILGMYSIIMIASYYKIQPDTISKYLVFATIPHIFLSYLTIKHQWYGGYMIESFSDFNTFFSMQLAVIFPFIIFVKNKITRNIIYMIFLVTLFLSGSRGGLLSLLLMYSFLNIIDGKIKFLINILFFGVLLIAIIYLFNPGIINYYLMKINPFDLDYNNVSDLNRYLFIIATVSYLPDSITFLVGNGIKNNQQIIHEYFTNINMDGASHGVVHNIFLELYSDYGILIVLFLLILILQYFFMFIKSYKKNIMNSAYLLSLGIFLINYNLEGNYVHYFFWFFMMFYTYTYYYIRKEKNATNNKK